MVTFLRKKKHKKKNTKKQQQQNIKLLGWNSGFRAIDDLPRAHWDETEFR